MKTQTRNAQGSKQKDEPFFSFSFPSFLRWGSGLVGDEGGMGSGPGLGPFRNTGQVGWERWGGAGGIGAVGEVGSVRWDRWGR